MNNGERHSEATKRRMKRAHKGVKFSDERKANMKAAAVRREAELRAKLALLAEYEQREKA